VVDTVPPTIECPLPPVTVYPDPGQCYASALGTLIEPYVWDECDDDLELTNDAPEGLVPIGSSIITWTVKDECNENTCEQEVTVYMWIDIHTQSCPNPLNPNPDGGVMSMAILGCDGFDVYNIDTETIKLRVAEYFGGGDPVGYLTPDPDHGFQYADLTQPPPDWEEECDCGDYLPGDDWTDLEFKIGKGHIVQYLLDNGYGPLEGGDVIVMEIVANLLPEYGGEELVGRDCLFITPIGGDGQSAAVVKRPDTRLPKVFGLGQNEPNPTTGVTQIRYQLPKAAQTTLKIYDSAGRLVKTLVNEKKKAGYYIAEWDAKDNNDKSVANGVYFYTMKAADYEATKQMILMRR
jgi:hypothetical protein